MSVVAILKFIHVYLLATVKYFLTFPYAIVIGLDYTQTIIVVTIGGITGFFFFYSFSGIVIRYFSRYKTAICILVRKYLLVDLTMLFRRKLPRKPLSTKRMRHFVKLRNSYGLWGIIIMTPVIISIPIGAFLLKKYYSTHKHVLAYMMISILGWSLVFTTIAVIMPKPL